MPEAQLEDSGSGLTQVTQGWFVVNVRDAEWWFAETRGARCAFENEYGASADQETSDFEQIYPRFEPSRRERPSYWNRLPWA